MLLFYFPIEMHVMTQTERGDEDKPTSNLLLTFKNSLFCHPSCRTLCQNVLCGIKMLYEVHIVKLNYLIDRIHPLGLPEHPEL